MSKVLSAMMASVLFFVAAQAQSLGAYNGNWANTNTSSPGLVSIGIAVSGSSVTVRPQGACSPTPCDWGVQAATPYSNNVSTNPLNLTKGLVSNISTSFSKTVLTAELKGDILEVTTFTSFTDGSGRSSYMSRESFRRAVATTLPAPTLLAPACGSVFSNFPRTTNFSWKPVAGAVSYIVEVDCFHCCQSGAWCTDIGKDWHVKKGIVGTSHSYDFTGAQPGRWRVSAVDAAGKVGAKSAWCEFKYTK